jgi:hypothetical protein
MRRCSAFGGGPSALGFTWPMCSASVRASASGSESTLPFPNPSGWAPPMRESWLMTSSSRR